MELFKAWCSKTIQSIIKGIAFFFQWEKMS
jgi:hypothetical protein